jgi:hypothetical protein
MKLITFVVMFFTFSAQARCIFLNEEIEVNLPQNHMITEAVRARNIIEFGVDLTKNNQSVRLMSICDYNDKGEQRFDIEFVVEIHDGLELSCMGEAFVKDKNVRINSLCEV